MKKLFQTLMSAALLGTLALLVLSAIVWLLGPLLAFGGGAEVARPLDGWAPRLTVVGLMWLAWLGWLGWGAWQRRRAAQALLKGVVAAPSASDQEAEVLTRRFSEAVGRLKSGAAGQGGALLKRGGDALYDLPWYIFIGAPGSGKTTALKYAGINLVSTDANGEPAEVKGVAGTRHCDWWFAPEAVLIDTAGRWTSQTSDREVDAAAWDKFLALLRRTRPRRPINGVLLTVSVQDLLTQSAPERQAHAAQLRARLQELQTKLGVRAPVYLLVTKTDLLAGFVETFDALPKDGRDQVWGFTFAQSADADPLAGFDAQYRALESRLVAGQLDRLQAERDVGRRAAIFGFPHEFASLRPLLGELLAQVFGASGAVTDKVPLRGVYFTSGTQEGNALDRVMGALARTFGLERRVGTLPGNRGKSFFLRRLLQDLVFPEAHLVAHNPQAERRRLLQRGAGFAALALACTALVVGLAVSHARNRAYVDQVAARLPALKQAVAALPPTTSADPSPLAEPLAAVRDAARPDGFAVDRPPLLNTLGLYQGELLDAGARTGYRHLLDHALLPRVVQRLEERVRAANRDNLEQAYEALKAYLMLYSPEHVDRAGLRAWITLDWDRQFSALPPEQRAALDQHLDALLAGGALQPARPVDATLVASVREMLTSYPLEYRIYSRMKRQFRGDIAEFSVAARAGPLAPKVFERASGLPLSRGIAGFFTRDGFRRAFSASVAPVAAQLAQEEQWVLGRSTSAQASAGQLLGNALTDRVKRLYLQDYIKEYDQLIADVRLQRLSGGLERSIDAARILAGVDSPLAAWLRALTAETTLVQAPAAQPNLVDKARQAIDKAKSDLASLADPAATPAPGDAGPMEKMVDDHFAAIHRQVSGQPPPIDAVLKAFGDVQAHLVAVDAAQKSKTAPPPPAAAAAAKAAVAQAPEAVQAMVTALVATADRQGRAAEQSALTGDLRPIRDSCVRTIANRYPFAPGSRADVMPDDLGQMFGHGGQLDAFYQRQLAGKVDTSGTVWAYKPLPDGTRPPTPPALADFQRAAKIKEAFFRGGGQTPAFKLDLKPVDLADFKELTLDIDGQVQKLTLGGPAATVSWPSARVASQVKLSGGGQTLVGEGPWALFRLFDRLDVSPTAQPERFNVSATLDGKRVRLEAYAGSALNPFRMREIQQFRCPEAL